MNITINSANFHFFCYLSFNTIGSELIAIEVICDILKTGVIMIKKAVIPAAGLGTRFLPATKAVPKELLPIVDTPTIQLIVQEVVDAGIDTVILISGRGKSAIVDHFDIYPELEEKLYSEGKKELAARLEQAGKMAKIVSVRQGKPLGLGHAVLQAKNLVGNEPFVVLLGDDLVDHEKSCTAQMINVFNKYKKSVIALMEIGDEDVSKFGISAGKIIEDRTMEVEQLVEKPEAKDAPSNSAIVGRYVLTPKIFDILENTKPGKGGEIQLTDALDKLREEEGLLGYHFEGKRYDAGDKFGFIQANIAFGLKNTHIKRKLLEYMREVLKENGR